MSSEYKIHSALVPYRILDLTEGGCMIGARILGDLGADVIKIEPREITMPSPWLIEHNEYVYRELLGMTDDEIADHIADGSIKTTLPPDFQLTTNL